MSSRFQALRGHQRYFSKTLKPGIVSLRMLFTVPYMVLIALTVALAGYLSFMNGQAAVNTVARQLRSQITSRMNEHLQAFLEMPHQITKFNTEAIRRGWIDPGNASMMQQYFLEQVHLQSAISSIYFGNINGGIIGSGREGKDNSFYVYSTDNLQSGAFKKYGVDDQANIKTLLTTIPNFDARTRPWYIGASQKKDAISSDVYILITGQDMAIAASRPVYDENNNLLGVLSVDITLSQLSNFFQMLEIPAAGQSFSLDHSGALVAVSTGETLVTGKDGKLERVYAKDSQSAAIRQSAEFLKESLGDYHSNSEESSQFELLVQGERQFLQVVPVHNKYGIDWTVVLAVPESAFMSQINANNRATFVIIVVALAASISVSVLITEKITGTISKISKSTQALTRGEWDRVPDMNSRIDELDGLATSFNHMKKQLRGTLENLTAEIEERKQAEDALRKSEEKFRTMFATTGDCMTITAIDDGKIIESNGKLLGYTREEMLGKTSSELGLWANNDDRARFFKEIQAKNRRVEDFEIALRRKDGTPLIGSVSANVVEIGDKPYILASTRDISARKQVQEELEHYRSHLEDLVEQRTAELKAANDQLVVLSRMKDEFVSNVSHELRTPITSLKLRCTLIEKHPEQLEKHLGTVKREVDRLGQTIEDLLQLSRIDQSRTDLSKSPIDLNLLIEHYVHDRLSIAHEKKLQLDFSRADNLPTVKADSGLLGQVVSILLTNAINYTPGGGQITVSTHTQRFDDQTWTGFSVSDTGPGIPPEDQARLFTRFFRGAAVRKVGVPGTGLGLSIAKEIMNRHQGRIEVESDGISGHGTTFRVWIPDGGKGNA